MKSLLHTGPSLQLKIAKPGDTEKTVGYATGLQFSVIQGQRPHFVVDSPFPAQIHQAAAPSMVRGQLTIFLPKGMTPESAGLVPYRQDQQGNIFQGNSQFINFRIYDRATTQLVFSADYCKVSDYTVSIRSRQTVMVTLNFEGMFLSPGNPG